MRSRTVQIHDLGIVEPLAALRYNMHLFQEMLDLKIANYDRADADKIPTQDHLVLLETTPTITTGEDGNTDFLLRSESELQALGITLLRTGRGGDISFHGPGQLMCSAILDLEYHGHSLVDHFRKLEDAAFAFFRTYGIHGHRIHKMNGVWLDIDDPLRIRKICTVGVQAERWVTVQGLGLNVNTDLSFYEHIVLCGMADKGITTLAKELGRPIDMREVKARFKEAFASVYDVSLVAAGNN